MPGDGDIANMWPSPLSSQVLNLIMIIKKHPRDVGNPEDPNDAMTNMMQ